jgi:hypothetical protein
VSQPPPAGKGPSQLEQYPEDCPRLTPAWSALAALMAIAAALILCLGRGMTFYRDEWTFVIYRDGHDLTNFISSYTGHLLLWPTAVYLFLFTRSGSTTTASTASSGCPVRSSSIC